MKKIRAEERRTPFSVTASVKEKAHIDAAAQAAGLPRATFVRFVIGDYIARKRQLDTAAETA